MHLLVLSAFRPHVELYTGDGVHCLNAPFGAQCFPTGDMTKVVDLKITVSMHLLVLSAFRLKDKPSERPVLSAVSMHLLVLSAFRLHSLSETMPSAAGLNAPFGAQCFPTGPGAQHVGFRRTSQCTFWCSVLSDSRTSGVGFSMWGSQCTFWCSVLSDSRECSFAPHAFCLNAPFGAQCFPTTPAAVSCIARRVSMHLLVLSAFRPGGGPQTTPSHRR
mgnify:CR=1 FL=1